LQVKTRKYTRHCFFS